MVVKAQNTCVILQAIAELPTSIVDHFCLEEQLADKL